ncbi:MAG: hypothetical protein JXR64_00210 [Spirochaetales bacterium]|nr:hypothetical protein [Spirochaetales bacterium]
MKNFNFIILLLIVTFYSCSAESKKGEISGSLVDGLRIVNIDNSLEINVYRGDYVVYESSKAGKLQIPELNIDISLPLTEDQPYVKMKTSGSYKFTFGKSTGIINVLDLQNSRYKEVTAKDAKSLIDNISPIILDVRTEGEFNSGHISNAILIPVQNIKSQLSKIEKYKDEPVFIYCHSGNRSTVAAKILIDAGFKEVYNLRNGVVDWANQGYELTK